MFLYINLNLAKTIGETELAQLIMNNEDLKEDLKIQLTNTFLFKKKELIKDALHHYLLYRADYYYSIDKRGAARSYLSFIYRNCLHRDEQSRLFKLKLRSKLLPIWVKNLKYNYLYL